MKFQDRIDKIIDYPANLSRVPNNLNNSVVAIENRNEVFIEKSLFQYGEFNLTDAQLTGVNAALPTILDPYPIPSPNTTNSHAIETNIWNGSSANILPLEGYYVGYQLDSRRANFASLLNLPDFTTEFFNELSGDGKSVDTSFYYFLHSLPLAIPMPIKSDVRKSSPDEVFDHNPSLLFKNNAGVYSIPDAYMWWLGGIWKYRIDGLPDIERSRYVTFEGSPDSGWKSVKFTIDPDGKNTNYFYSATYSTDTTPTLVVDTIKFTKWRAGSNKTQDAVQVTTYEADIINNYIYSVDSLNGIGNYQDLFSLVHREFYDTSLPADKSLLNWNVDDKMRTFPTYDYSLGSIGTDGSERILSLYASYNVFTYNNSNTPILPIKVNSTEDQFLKKSAFDAYTGFWNYIFYFLTQPEPLDYTDIRQAIINFYVVTPWTEGQVNFIKDIIFNESAKSTEVSNDFYYHSPNVLVTNMLGEYDARNPIVAQHKLFESTDDVFSNFIDLIGLQVIKFIDAVNPTRDVVDLSNYMVYNKDFSCILYPSAGGVAGLQYVLGSLMNKTPYWGNAAIGSDTQYVYGTESEEMLWSERQRNDQFTATVINLILNSSRWVWGSGPFVGDSSYNVKDLVTAKNFNLAVPTDAKNFLGRLGDSFLSGNNIRSKRKDTVYILDSEQLTKRDSTILKYNDVVDYIGAGVLDVFEDKFNNVIKTELSTGGSDAKNILLSLLIVDKDDFNTITVDGIEYSVDQQIQYLVSYNVWLTNAYTSGVAFVSDPIKAKNICKVMNASLTQAQTIKINRVVEKLLNRRSLLNVGSIFDYGVSTDSEGLTVKNMFNRSLINDTLNIADDGQFIKKALFGDQPVKAYSEGGNISGPSPSVDKLYKKYYYRGVPNLDVNAWANYFFETIDVAPNSATIKIAKDFMLLYFKQSPTYEAFQMIPAFLKMRNIVSSWIENSTKHVDICLFNAIRHLADGEQSVITAQIEDASTENKTDINVLKQITYYNIKALFDNWILVTPDRKTELIYMRNRIIAPNSVTNPTVSFMNHFLFVDRANRNIGHNMLINIDWLKSYFERNYGYNDINTNVSLYSFLSSMASQHSSLIHALPSFIDFGNFNTSEGQNYAGDLFGTFDYVDIVGSNPKFLFQFIGNTNTLLNTSQNINLRSASKSYSLLKSRNNKSSNISQNIGDGVHTPSDLLEQGASAMAFVVDFGEQHQQIFSNLELDQNEFQNTEEGIKVITQFVKNRTQTQGSNLFSIYTERSYTAQVESLGNLMIQPLMFFEITNMPLFYGTYWITNVRHSITPNDIKTTFKGVRQPMAVLPSKGDVLLQLSELNVSNILGVDAVKKPTATTTRSGSANGSTSSNSNSQLVVVSKLTPDAVLANQIQVKNFFKLQLSGKNGVNEEIAKVITAGIMGNINAESHFNPNALNPNDSNGKPSYGLIQWNEKSYTLECVGNTMEKQLTFLKTDSSDGRTGTHGYTTFINKTIEAVGKGPVSTTHVEYAAQFFAKYVEKCQYCKQIDEYNTKGPYNVRTKPALIFYGKFNNPNDPLYWNS